MKGYTKQNKLIWLFHIPFGATTWANVSPVTSQWTGNEHKNPKTCLIPYDYNTAEPCITWNDTNQGIRLFFLNLFDCYSWKGSLVNMKDHGRSHHFHNWTSMGKSTLLVQTKIRVHFHRTWFILCHKWRDTQNKNVNLVISHTFRCHNLGKLFSSNKPVNW
jgi:hypothetical protein